MRRDILLTVEAQGSEACRAVKDGIAAWLGGDLLCRILPSGFALCASFLRI